MPLTPGKDETEADFMQRCMHELDQSDTERPQDQKVAICLRYWRDGQKATLRRLLDSALALLKDGYDPNQPRSGRGRWTDRHYNICPACGHRWGVQVRKPDESQV